MLYAVAMRRRGLPDSISLIFGGIVILGFVFIYWWFGVFPNQSRRGREPAVLAEDPDRFWLMVAAAVALATFFVGLGVARMFKR